ncbi:MAG: DUF1343 domain-containing protein [Polyangiaceae bacterium]|nr:DUF1343 domain-containing protein [Polyangiaceae bacterium]
MRFGIDRLSTCGALCARLRGARVGVLCHAASVDSDLVHLRTALGALGIAPRLWLAPEHGLAGAAQDMATIGDARDRTGAPVVSLYGSRFEDLSPRPEHLAELDVLLIDLCDVGSRYYTFVWTALLALRACARAPAPVHVVVLDRPNPLGGVAFEGRTQAPGFCSFVGLEPLPVRHGLTVGELLVHFARRDGLPLGPDGALSVVPVEGWSRASLAHDWGRPFVLPSPNMPTPDTALVYPGGCLLEGTNLSEGRGHTRPFEVFGAPWLDGEALARDFHALGLPGCRARPLEFQPTFHKHAGLVCGGIELHPTCREAFRPVASYVALIALAARQSPAHFRFRTERYEFVDDIPAFDLLTGSEEARAAILRGDEPLAIAESTSAFDPGHAELVRAASALAATAAW